MTDRPRSRPRSCPYCMGTGHLIHTTCIQCHGAGITGITGTPPAIRTPVEIEPADPRSLAVDGDW